MRIHFPELAVERERLTFARASRDRMIDRLERVDPQSAADEFTAEYVEVTVEEALEDLRSPGAGDFFGRIDTGDGPGGAPEHWYIGRRHIEDDEHDPVVVDWRAPIAAPFYRATGVDPLGVDLRRRFMLDDGEITAYLDEHLDDPDAADVAGGIPDPVLAEIGAERTGAMREIVATIQAEQDHVIRAPMDQLLVVQGRPGHRQDRRRPPPRRLPAVRAPPPPGPRRRPRDRAEPGLPRLHRQRPAVARRAQRAPDDGARPVRAEGRDHRRRRRRRGTGQGRRGDARRARAGGACSASSRRPPTSSCRSVCAGWCSRRRRSASGSTARPTAWCRSTSGACGCARSPSRSCAGAPATTCGRRPRRCARRSTRRGRRSSRSASSTSCCPGRAASGGSWTAADQLLVDEANSILNGPPLVYGHVVVDEAQDHSAVALRVIGRRSPAASMTLVGDVAQSTTPAGQERWADVYAYLAAPWRAAAAVGEVAELTIGYRVPEPILTIANRLLPLTGVDASPSRSVRIEGHDADVDAHDVAPSCPPPWRPRRRR